MTRRTVEFLRTVVDPIAGLKWTRKTTEKIAEVLQQIECRVSANTVARLAAEPLDSHANILNSFVRLALKPPWS